MCQRLGKVVMLDVLGLPTLLFYRFMETKKGIKQSNFHAIIITATTHNFIFTLSSSSSGIRLLVSSMAPFSYSSSMILPSWSRRRGSDHCTCQSHVCRHHIGKGLCIWHWDWNMDFDSHFWWCPRVRAYHTTTSLGNSELLVFGGLEFITHPKHNFQLVSIQTKLQPISVVNLPVN